jgi:hypothetical protein
MSIKIGNATVIADDLGLTAGDSTLDSLTVANETTTTSLLVTGNNIPRLTLTNPQYDAATYRLETSFLALNISNALNGVSRPIITIEYNGHVSIPDGNLTVAQGNLLVGKTVTTLNTPGNVLYEAGGGQFTVPNGISMHLNRTGASSGDILGFYHDGTTVGSIGTSNSDLTIGNSDVGLKFHDANNTIYPWNVGSDAASDGQLDLGAGSIRFKDLYLSGGLRGDTTFTNNAGTTEYAQFTSSGSLLVSKSSQADGATAGHEFLSDGRFYHTKSGDHVGRLNRLSTDGDILRFAKDGTTVGSIGSYSSGLDIAGSSRGIRFSGSTIFPVTNVGGVSDNSVQLGYSGGRFTDLYLSGGVYLGGDTSANKLDDYETGTWTPTAGSGSVTVNSATYTKVGDLVHLSARLDSFTDTTTNATLRVDGLPFTRATGTEAIGSLVGNNLGDSEITAVFAQTTYLEFYASSSTTSYNALKYNELGSSNQMYFSITYRAA